MKPTQLNVNRKARSRRRSIEIVCGIAMPVMFAATANAAVADDVGRVRAVILSSRHMGAHGMGYNADSLNELAKKLSVSDIQIILTIYSNSNSHLGMAAGAQFALASQCRDGLEAVTRTVKDGTFMRSGFKSVDFTDAQNILGLIAKFDRCDASTQQDAVKSQAMIEEFTKADYARRRDAAIKEQREDARIQENSLKLLAPSADKPLTLSEREEVFHRSVKAMGLDGPRTPDQEEMVKRMYDAMVLQHKGDANNSRQ